VIVEFIVHLFHGGLPRCCSVYEELLQERTLEVCEGGVDVIIDFVSSPRTVKRDLKVLREVSVIRLVYFVSKGFELQEKLCQLISMAILAQSECISVIERYRK